MNFKKAEKILINKLRGLNFNEINLSEYSINYLNFLTADIEETLGRYSQVIKEAVLHTNSEISQMTIVDYGGGTGLLSLLAKELGFQSVIYNDIFETSCKDVEKLSQAFKLDLDGIIHGDASGLVEYLNSNSIKADLICSYDVIEHVYNVENNFQSFSQLAKRPDCIVYGSGANIRNPFYSKSVRQKQISAEHHDREPSIGQKSADSLKSYLSLRKEIISDFASTLTRAEVDLLGKQTRGLVRSDIEETVRQYLDSGEISYRITHPTNTCDPLTGNWCENLLDFRWLLSTARSAGFNAKFSKGLYSPSCSSLRGLLRLIFNILNRSLGTFGFKFSPFYILILQPSQKVS